MTDHAVARRGDPDTSWQAARSLDPAVLRKSQRIVLMILQDAGPMTDETLVRYVAGRMSPSGTRSRRAELVDKGLAYDTGKREVLASGRKAIVWAGRWLEWSPLSLWEGAE